MAAFSDVTPPPTTWSSHGWTYRARIPFKECALTERVGGRGEARTMERATGSNPVASSNAEFCLPTMNTRLPAYVSADGVST